MNIGAHRLPVLLACCAVALIYLALPASTLAADAKKAPAATPAAKPAELPLPPPPLPSADPLGRSTPYGTVIGFLRAADKGDYELAANFLDGKQSAKEKEKLARGLKIVLNRGVKIGLDDLSRVPEGRLDDGLSVYQEKVGTAHFGTESLDILLRRTTLPDSPPIWLFTAETLRGVTNAADQLDLAWGEMIWPEQFREIQFLSYPLFLLINQLVGIPLLLGFAWFANRGLLRLLRPLALRHGGEHGERALVQAKWLLFLLIFSILLRILGAQAVTVAGRIFFASAATVLAIVAASWLLVRMTRYTTGLRIHHLQQAGAPSRIAGVDLFGWVLAGVCMLAGLFLTLRVLGFEITPAIAGLGVGGIAIAFAAQKTIENLFGTVTVVTDEAIHVGDQCQAGTTEGRVESIGLRSTRIRTADRTVVSIPNGQLAAMSLVNLTHRDKFLFRHTLRLRYDTSADQLRDVLAKIRKMLFAHPQLEPSTIRVRLVRFGDASLELEAFAYVLTRSQEIFLEIQESLLLKIMDVIEASGTAVAPPPGTESAPADFALNASAANAAASDSRPDSRRA